MKTNILIITFLYLIPFFSFSQYPRDQKIIAGEYFINSDPGEGNGTAINTGGTPLWEVTINVPNISLPIGSKFYVRFKSSNGKWSAPRSIMRKPYFENSGGSIQYEECFINTDPGQGNGQQVTFLNGIAEINGLTLKRGDKVYVRVKDNMNRWSPARPVTFNFKEIDKAEYYIQYGSGGNTNSQIMNLSPYNPYSCIYSANADNIPRNNLDTVLIRFQTKDKFYSQWAKRRLDNVGIEEKWQNAFHFFNFPNPFSNQTKVCFELPEKSFVNLRIIGLLGNKFLVLANEQMSKGKHEIQFDGSILPDGIYYCRLEADNGCNSIKLVIQK